MGGKRIDRTGVAPGQIGMVFQQFNLFPHMTALENITLAPRFVRKLNRRAAEERAGCATPKDGPGGQGRRKTCAAFGRPAAAPRARCPWICPSPPPSFRSSPGPCLSPFSWRRSIAGARHESPGRHKPRDALSRAFELPLACGARAQERPVSRSAGLGGAALRSDTCAALPRPS